MANLSIKDSTGATKYLELDGSGTTTDPFVHATSLRGRGGNTAAVGQFGELLVGALNSDIEVAFGVPVVETTFDLEPVSVTGDGTVTNTTGVMTLTTTTGTAEIASQSRIRYRPGHTSYARFTLSATGAGVAEEGVKNLNGDKFSIKISNGAISVLRSRAGSATEVSSASFNGDYSVSNLTLTNINIFEIRWGFLGVADVQFWVFGPNGAGWQVLHTMYTAGTLTTSHVMIPNFRMFASASGAMVAKTISWNGGSYGENSLAGSRAFAHSASATLSGTTVATLAHYVIKPTFNGVASPVTARAIRIGFFAGASATGYGTVEFKIYANATVTGTPNQVDINTTSSGVAYDLDVNYASSGAVVYIDWAGYAGANRAAGAGHANFDAAALGLIGHPGDTFTITAQNVEGAEAVTARCTFNWVEYS